MTDLSNKLNNRQILTTRSSLSDRLNQSEIKKGTVIVIKESLKSCYQKSSVQLTFDFQVFHISD